MKKSFLIIVWLMTCVASHAQQAETVYGEILIRFDEGYKTEEFAHQVEKELGILPSVRVLSCVSDYMNIWLIGFDESAVDKKEFLAELKKLNGVNTAQVNHILEERVIPNDPFYSMQWHHFQENDHDIDTDLAWNVTTGGTTTTGDDIVVCIVELGGAKWDVADIVDNHWVNSNEIASNSIDDDNNGYIDDVDGWNISSNSDNLSQGDHGTRVSSMIGAKGNNENGITGVNWNVKLMQVEIGGVSEANAIAGYNYPLKMRKMYNQTNGASGAFVVATNSSWGTNNGQPADAPLWCAMYDSLGAQGVLSCGSTTNSNVNVDVVGDLPTACPSEFMVSVGRTNWDDVRNSGGYGLTTIDLMAPGDNVYLANNTSYGNTTGTSFSGPCVAGAIALLYSAPCNSLMQIASINPVLAAQMVRDYIFDGVDQTAQLLDETVSGGRLNVNNSMTLLIEGCDNSTCIAPFGVFATQVAGELDYMLSWDVLIGSDSFSIRYKPTSSSEWLEFPDVTTSDEYTLEDLLACTEYEFQVKGSCNDTESEWSSSYLWTTDGCCVNPDAFNQISFTGSSIDLEWNVILAADNYDVTFVPESGDPIIFEDITQNSFSFTGLTPCTSYTVQVVSGCENASLPANDFFVHTPGCTDCDQITYCTVGAGSQYEYIAQVELGDINRTSESDGGYILVEDQTDTLFALSTYTLYCTPGYSGMNFNENFIAWIDYNSDGDFDDVDEVIFDAPNSTTTEISGQFTVPAYIQNGIVRLRVAMRYTTGNNPAEPMSCGEWTYGEVEDYCIMLDQTVGIEEKIFNPEFVLYPNPSNDIVTFRAHSSLINENFQFCIHSAQGQLVREMTIRNGQQIDVGEISPGSYVATIRAGEKFYVCKLMVQ